MLNRPRKRSIRRRRSRTLHPQPKAPLTASAERRRVVYRHRVHLYPCLCVTGGNVGNKKVKVKLGGGACMNESRGASWVGWPSRGSTHTARTTGTTDATTHQPGSTTQPPRRAMLCGQSMPMQHVNERTSNAMFGNHCNTIDLAMTAQVYIISIMRTVQDRAG